jgi:hypothetical protein
VADRDPHSRDFVDLAIWRSPLTTRVGVPRCYRDRKEMAIDEIEPPIVIKAWPPKAVN